MLTPNGIYVIFIVFMVMCCVSQSFRLYTEKNLTAVRGRNIFLPCEFSVSAYAVYWYKHNFTGAPDDGASLVARDYRGNTDPVPGFERFSITRDYSLIIRNITVHEETTYSCLVVEHDTERGHTNLKVIALAEPLEPIIEIIEPCSFTTRRRCVYHVNMPTSDENTSDNLILVCKLLNVRPLPILTWMRSDGRLLKNATHQMQEKDGLFSISSQIQVSKSHLNHQFVCQAEGEAVNGLSSVVISFEDSSTHACNDRVIWMASSVISYALLLVQIIVLSVGLKYYRRRRRLPCLAQDAERSKTNRIPMAVVRNDDDEPDEDTERWMADGISTDFGYNGGGEPDRDRRGSNWWCSCGNCPVVQTDVECLCCRELKRCREIKTNGCIIDSEEFEDVCLNKSLIRTTLSLRSKKHQIPRNMRSTSNQSMAYKLWTDYLHGYSGKEVSIPACVVTRVRQEFPDEYDAYPSFIYGKRGKVGKKKSRCILQ